MVILVPIILNHKANLASVCKDCHEHIHKEGIRLKRVKTTKGMMLEKVELQTTIIM